MAMIQGIRIRNFKSLKDITLGNLCDDNSTAPLTPITAVIGKNGVGKTSLFDVFGFLADCMKYGVAEACDVRGGFDRVVSQGQKAIYLCLVYQSQETKHIFRFELTIDVNEKGLPQLQRERLFRCVNNNERGLYLLVAVNDGAGFAWSREHEGQLYQDLSEVSKFNEKPEMVDLFLLGVKPKGEQGITLSDKSKDKLAVSILARVGDFPRCEYLYYFIENWYMSYFTPDAARNINQKGAQQHLNRSGDNLSNVVEFMMDEHPERFQAVLERIASKIPGIGKISTYRDSVTRNLYLMFEGKGFAKPFTQSQMSDGTLKLFTYLLLLEDPEPAPLLCIEEPENGLYHQLLETLAQEIREHTSNARSQVFITTHQPYFVDALEPEEVWILEKGEDGFSTIRRASDDPLIQNMVEEGLPLGGLWYSGYLDRG